MKKTILLFLLVIALSFLLNAQNDNNMDPGLLKQMVANREGAIHSIKSNSILAIISCITIAVLGFIAAVIQTIKMNNLKTTTAIIGGLITLITILSAAFIEGEYKQLKKQFTICEIFKKDIYAYLKVVQDDRDNVNRERYLLRAQKKFERMEIILDFERDNLAPQIEPEPLKGEASNKGNAFIVGSPGLLWAQGKESETPSWINNLPQDDYFIYFTGKGTSTDLNKVREIADQEVRASIIEYILGAGGIADEVSIQSEVNRLIEIIDRYFSKSVSADYITYTSFVLARIKKETLRFSFRKLNINLAPDQVLKVEANLFNQANLNRYIQNRNAIYEFILTAAENDLAPDAYSNFAYARSLRKQGYFNEAISLLEPIVTKYPNFYFGWYNLALCYDNTSENIKAESAYRNAVLLEPSQNIRDASIYNTYGYFLLRQNKPDQAILQLEKCLKIAPNHETAKRTLNAAIKARGH
jgi:tetratricopeptide (TPR) repeat protein